MKSFKLINIILIVIVIVIMLISVVKNYNESTELYYYNNSINTLKEELIDTFFPIDKDNVDEFNLNKFRIKLDTFKEEFEKSSVSDSKYINESINEIYLIIESDNFNGNIDTTQFATLIDASLMSRSFAELVFKPSWNNSFLELFRIRTFIFLFISIFWIKYFLDWVSDHRYLKNIYKLKPVEKLHRYVNNNDTITKNLIFLYLITIVISSIYLYSYGISLDLFDTFLHPFVLILSIVSLIIYFFDERKFTIMKSISLVGFIIYFIVFVIIRWGQFKIMLYSFIIIFTLIPITIQYIKELKIKVNKMFLIKIILSLVYVFVGILIIYLLGYIG